MIIQTKKDLPERRPNDFYPTPYPFAKEALSHLAYLPTPGIVIDPGAGDGVWGEAVRQTWPTSTRWEKSPYIVGYEIRDEPVNSKYVAWTYNDWVIGDFLEQKLPDTIDLVVGNPPYNIAEKIFWKSMDALRSGGWMALMLSLRFLSSARRLKIWEAHPPRKVIVCANRPSFTGDGKTNAMLYAFYYWEKGYSGPTTLDWTYIEKE